LIEHHAFNSQPPRFFVTLQWILIDMHLREVYRNNPAVGWRVKFKVLPYVVMELVCSQQAESSMFAEIRRAQSQSKQIAPQ